MKQIIKPFLVSLLLLTLPANAALVTLDITFDSFPEEVAFGIWDESYLLAFVDGSLDIFDGEAYDVAQSSPIGFGDGYVAAGDFTGEGPGPWQFIWDLAPGSYIFILFDEFGDGICCVYGNGEFTLSLEGNVILAGGAFADYALANFDIVGTQVPLPGAALLFGSLIAGWVGFGRRSRT